MSSVEEILEQLKAYPFNPNFKIDIGSMKGPSEYKKEFGFYLNACSRDYTGSDKPIVEQLIDEIKESINSINKNNIDVEIFGFYIYKFEGLKFIRYAKGVKTKS